MFKKNLTSRDFLKIRSCEQLSGAQVLTPAERIAQAEFAQTVRNFFFCTNERIARLDFSASGGAGTALPTPRFSEPLIITDLLMMHDYKQFAFEGGGPPGPPVGSANRSRFLLKLTLLGTEGSSEGEDFFGLQSSAKVGAEFLLKYEKNNSQAIGASNPVFDAENKYLAFVPRLLKPYQSLTPAWFVNTDPDTDTEFGVLWALQLGVRSVRVLKPDDPYRVLSPLVRQQIVDYVNTNQPETFYLETRIPLASIPAASGAGGNSAVTIRTPQQGRPLLILGAASNLEGCQATLVSEPDHYQFTYADQSRNFDGLVTTANLSAPPLCLWAPDTDFRNTNMFNMFPVPHLLAPGAELRISLTGGLMADLTTFQQVKKTRNDQDARITFVCRTV